MAERNIPRRRGQKSKRRPTSGGATRKNKLRQKRIVKSNFVVKRAQAISKARLERGLRVLTDTGDLKVAARAIRVTPKQFQRAAKRRRAIRKIRGRWKAASRLSRRIPVFTAGKQVAVTVRKHPASQIGQYMSAVGKFLQTNDVRVLAEFTGRGVKDINRQFHQFETSPNVLYRLSSAGGEPFEEIYRIVL